MRAWDNSSQVCLFFLLISLASSLKRGAQSVVSSAALAHLQKVYQRSDADGLATVACISGGGLIQAS